METGAVAEARGPLDRCAGLLLREPARDVRREAHLDAVQLPRGLRSGAHSLVDLLPGAPAPDAFRRAEDASEVDTAVRGGLGRVVDNHLVPVLLRLQGVGRQDPDLDEVGEVAEAVERLEVVG